MCLGKEYDRMYFWNFYHFNIVVEFHPNLTIAIYGRQNWRIIADLNALSNQIFKVKYFSRWNFLYVEKSLILIFIEKIYCKHNHWS